MSGTMVTILPLIALIVIMYFLMIRPQKKRERETNAMRNSLQVGDEIITIGGLCGKVVKTKDESIVIQAGPDKTKFEMMRGSVSKVTKEGPGHNRTTTDDFDEISDAEDKEVRKSKPKRMKKAAPVVDSEDEIETNEADVVEETVDVADNAAEDVVEAVEEKAEEAE
jgi:preprotein translocase subunit YajC